MRQWHRWIGICFAAFLLIIGGTGVTIQMLDLIATKNKPDGATANVAAVPPTAPDRNGDGGDSRKHRNDHDADQTPPTAAIADAPKPKQPQSTLRRWNHWIKDLHSGVLLGPIGIFISILSGLTLIFFAISGMWMYWQMFTRRKAAGRTNFFWKR